ncbi:hypothetical protein [Effusibacillus pohliae]|uniref:hypothetical protein n=1 Tax=Effusibacillus pohliae TaxID=232270 RepID=UPI000380E851|nr:hypothetical protein [Effusibacillus pohliae]
MSEEKESIRLVYDQSVGLSAVAVKNNKSGDRVIPLKDNSFLALTKEKDIDLTDVVENVIKLKQEQTKNTGKYTNSGVSMPAVETINQNGNNRLLTIAAVGLLLVLSAGVYLVLRKK